MTNFDCDSSCINNVMASMQLIDLGGYIAIYVHRVSSGDAVATCHAMQYAILTGLYYMNLMQTHRIHQAVCLPAQVPNDCLHIQLGFSFSWL